MKFSFTVRIMTITGSSLIDSNADMAIFLSSEYAISHLECLLAFSQSIPSPEASPDSGYLSFFLDWKFVRRSDILDVTQIYG